VPTGPDAPAPAISPEKLGYGHGGRELTWSARSVTALATYCGGDTASTPRHKFGGAGSRPSDVR